MLRPVVYKNDQSSDINLQSDALCRAVQSDGKSAVSIWQLRRHLQLFADGAEKAVSSAHHLIAPQPRLMADIDDMSVYAWLRRSCLESLAATLEDADYKKAADLYGRPLPADVPGLKKFHSSVIEAIVKGEGANAAAERAYCAPDRLRLRDDFYLRFLEDDGKSASASSSYGDTNDAELAEVSQRFADLLCDQLGRGTISLAQLQNHLEKYRLGGGSREAGACLAAVPDDLINHVRAPEVAKPTPAPPTEWVHGWLKAHSLEEYSPKFIEAKICTKEDLAAEPKLSDSDLNDLGVKVLGDNRRLVRLIAEL